MTERLRDIVASDDPAVADLARMIRATGDLAPRAGAKNRVRRALVERPLARRRPWWQAAVVAALVLVIVLPAAIAGVRWIVAVPPPGPASVPAPAPVPAPAVPGSPRGHHRPVTADVPSVPDLPDAEDATIAAPAVPRAWTAPAGDGELAPASPAAVAVPPSAGSGAEAPRLAPEPPVTPAPLPPVRERPVPPPPAPERRPHLPGRVTAIAPAADVPSADAPAAGSTGAAARASSRPPAEPGAATAATAADTSLVVDAMRRLRRGRDPRAALPQLDAYLARFPDGDLAEEVRALAIEAHAALGDAAACSLAEQYLQRYPHGRFRDPAERTAQRCPPPP